MKPWVEDIIEALKNLGGQAHRRDIFNEVRRIRTEPIPLNLEATVQERIQAYSSDSAHFQNKGDYFKKIGNGIWSLRDQNVVHLPTSSSPRKKSAFTSENKPLESFEEITSVLRTIKEYRDYYDPKASNWRKYIASLFQILGFYTEDEESVLNKLYLMGSTDNLRAIAWNMCPGDDPNNMWSSTAFEKNVFQHMAESFKTQWIVVTDGLYLKIMRFKGNKKVQVFFWQDFDTTVCQEQIDSFYQIYKVFSLIKS
jgi:hypothetical protein